MLGCELTQSGKEVVLRTIFDCSIKFSTGTRGVKNTTLLCPSIATTIHLITGGSVSTEDITLPGKPIPSKDHTELNTKTEQLDTV